jgi:hypothetical protein
MSPLSRDVSGLRILSYLSKSPDVSTEKIISQATKPCSLGRQRQLVKVEPPMPLLWFWAKVREDRGGREMADEVI